MAKSRQACTFFLGELLYGVDIGAVQEVVVPDCVTPVPLAQPAVAGLINLRGTVVTAIDLRRHLGLYDHTPRQRPLHLVLRTDREPVSFEIDRMHDVLDVDDAQFCEPPDVSGGAARELLVGAYKLPDRLLLLLDIDKILYQVTQLHRPVDST